MYAKELRAQLGRIGTQLQAIVDKAKAENNRGLTSDERTQFHALESDYTALEDSIKASERSTAITSQLAASLDPSKTIIDNVEELQDTLRLTPAQKRDKAKTPHAKAFSNYLRVGIQDLPVEDRALMQKLFVQNAQSTTPGSAGGYVVPTGFSDVLEAAELMFCPMKAVMGSIKTGTGNPLPWPTMNDTTNEGEILGVNAPVTSQDIVFNQVVFSSFIASSKLFLVPQALMQDSYFDMDTLVATCAGTRLGRCMARKGTVGVGTTEPLGIVTAVYAAGAGNIVPISGPAEGLISYANLVDVEGAVDPAYRVGSSWMFADAMLKVLKKLVDGNQRPLWQPGLSASFREGAAVDIAVAKPTILDHPYVINQAMAAPAADAKSVIFGDLSKFVIRQVAGGVTLLRLVERYAEYLQTGFIAFERWDSQYLDAGTNPIAIGVNAHT